MIKNDLGPGVRYAIEAGMRAAAAPVVVVMMADLSDDFVRVDEMITRVEAGADVVCGSRYMKGGAQHGGPRLKKFLSRNAGRTLRWFAGLPVHDPTNSFKAYKKSFLDEAKIESTAGFVLGLELTVKAHLAGKRVEEVPVVWTDRTRWHQSFSIVEVAATLSKVVFRGDSRPLLAVRRETLATETNGMSGRVKLLLVILFAVRAIAVFYAYDRRPMITSNDEVYWAEPAWSLLHGHGYRLPCCDGKLFGDFYPQHPPIYVFILTGAFQLFGFTPASMRVPSIIAHLVGLVLMLAILLRLRRFRVLDRCGFFVAAVLVLSDFTTLYLAPGAGPIHSRPRWLWPASTP